MAVRRIVTVQEANPVLRTAARPVTRLNGNVRAVMDDLLETMRDAPGVGLAAPQIGVSLRVIAVECAADADDPNAGTRCLVLANPRILWSSDEIVEAQEACLSIPTLFGDVPRATAIRVAGLRRDGSQVDLRAAGFEARVIQHEIDHLDGVLFTDRVTGLDKLYHIRETETGELERVPFAVPAAL